MLSVLSKSHKHCYLLSERVQRSRRVHMSYVRQILVKDIACMHVTLLLLEAATIGVWTLSCMSDKVLQVVNISSSMGSIGSATKYLKDGLNPMSKMQLGYRTSKAALNMGEQPFTGGLPLFKPSAMSSRCCCVCPQAMLVFEKQKLASAHGPPSPCHMFLCKSH